MTARSLLPVVLLGAAGFSSCRAAGDCACPFLAATLLVEAAPDGGAVADVSAFVVGVAGSDGELYCSPDSSATFCTWSAAESVDAGRYTIEVAAPGYQTVDVAVTLSLGRFGAALSPGTVSLMPGDGGP